MLLASSRAPAWPAPAPLGQAGAGGGCLRTQAPGTDMASSGNPGVACARLGGIGMVPARGQILSKTHATCQTPAGIRDLSSQAPRTQSPRLPHPAGYAPGSYLSTLPALSPSGPSLTLCPGDSPHPFQASLVKRWGGSGGRVGGSGAKPGRSQPAWPSHIPETCPALSPPATPTHPSSFWPSCSPHPSPPHRREQSPPPGSYWGR